MAAIDTRQIQNLPEELISTIFDYLSKRDLYQTSLVSRYFYSHSIPLIWRSVDLVDCRTFHDHSTINTEGDDPENEILTDEHDDTPMLRKLVLFAKSVKNFAPFDLT